MTPISRVGDKKKPIQTSAPSWSNGGKLRFGDQDFTARKIQVQPGDTLSGLLQKAAPNLPPEVRERLLEQVKAENGLDPSASLKAGQDLMLPIQAGVAQETGKPAGKIGEQLGADRGGKAKTGPKQWQSARKGKTKGKDAFRTKKPTAGALDGLGKFLSSTGTSRSRDTEPVVARSRIRTKQKGAKEAPAGVVGPRQRALSAGDRAYIGEKARAILDAGDPKAAVAKLGETLQNLSPTGQAELLNQVLKDDPSGKLGARILNEAGRQIQQFKGLQVERAEKTESGTRRVEAELPKGLAQIAKSVGNAFESGALSSQDLQNMTDPKNLGTRPNPFGIASVVAESGSSKLQQELSQSLLKTAQKGTLPKTTANNFLSGAAEAASGNLEATNALLESVGEDGLKDFMDRIGPNGNSDIAANPALGHLIGAAGGIHPSTKVTNELFDRGALMKSDHPAMIGGLGKFFVQQSKIDNHKPGQVHSDLVERLTRAEGDRNRQRAVLGAFAEKVVFGPNSPNRAEVHKVLSEQYAARVANTQHFDQQRKAEAGPDAISAGAMNEAQELGTLNGALEAGMRWAKKNAGDSGAPGVANLFGDLLTDIAKSVVAFDIEIPGIGSIKDKGIEAVKGLIFDDQPPGKLDSESLAEKLDDMAGSIASHYHGSMAGMRVRVNRQLEPKAEK